MGNFLQCSLPNNYRTISQFLVILFFVMILLPACAIFRTNVDVANNRESIENCKYLGEVYGTENNYDEGDWIDAGSSALFAKNDLKRQARRLGADTILIKDADPNGKKTVVKGEAYNCNSIDDDG